MSREHLRIGRNVMRNVAAPVLINAMDGPKGWGQNKITFLGARPGPSLHLTQLRCSSVE